MDVKGAGCRLNEHAAISELTARSPKNICCAPNVLCLLNIVFGTTLPTHLVRHLCIPLPLRFLNVILFFLCVLFIASLLPPAASFIHVINLCLYDVETLNIIFFNPSDRMLKIIN